MRDTPNNLTNKLYLLNAHKTLLIKSDLTSSWVLLTISLPMEMSLTVTDAILDEESNKIVLVVGSLILLVSWLSVGVVLYKMRRADGSLLTYNLTNSNKLFFLMSSDIYFTLWQVVFTVVYKNQTKQLNRSFIILLVTQFILDLAVCLGMLHSRTLDLTVKILELLSLQHETTDIIKKSKINNLGFPKYMKLIAPIPVKHFDSPLIAPTTATMVYYNNFGFLFNLFSMKSITKLTTFDKECAVLLANGQKLSGNYLELLTPTTTLDLATHAVQIILASESWLSLVLVLLLVLDVTNIVIYLGV